MKREIKNCLTWLANQIALDYIYGDKFHSNKEIMEKFYDSIKNEIEWNTMTTQQAKELRFARWSDDMPNLWLIPIWLYPVIPDDLPLICINGEKTNTAEGIDTDIRFGCLAYGIEIKEEEK